MEKAAFGSLEFYDQIWANDWQDMERFNPTARHLERMICDTIRQLTDVKSVVDVGCGMGVNVKRIHAKFPQLRITGTDISPKSLEMAEKYVGKSELINYAAVDIATGPLPATYDLVLCSQVLEHIENDRKALESLAGMCAKYLLITVPSGRYNRTSKVVGHHRHYSKAELLEKVQAAGFTVMKVREWGFPFHSVYKTALGLLSEEKQRQVGLGKYGPMKLMLSNVLYGLFHANVFNRGENIVLLASAPGKASS